MSRLIYRNTCFKFQSWTIVISIFLSRHDYETYPYPRKPHLVYAGLFNTNSDSELWKLHTIKDSRWLLTWLANRQVSNAGKNIERESHDGIRVVIFGRGRVGKQDTSVRKSVSCFLRTITPRIAQVTVERVIIYKTYWGTLYPYYFIKKFKPAYRADLTLVSLNNTNVNLLLKTQPVFTWLTNEDFEVFGSKSRVVPISWNGKRWYSIHNDRHFRGRPQSQHCDRTTGRNIDKVKFEHYCGKHQSKWPILTIKMGTRHGN